jgi:hypothetical protein
MLQSGTIYGSIFIAEGLLIALIVCILIVLVLFGIFLLIIVLILAIFFIFLVQHNDWGRHQVWVVPHII